MLPMCVAQVAQAVYGRVVPVSGESGDDVMVTSALTDSREVCAGSLFVAIVGERVDGHEFVTQAASRGAVCAIVDHELADVPIVQVVVSDTVEALGLLAKDNIRRRRAAEEPFAVVGVTGSVGKTTTKDMLAALLSRLGPTVAPVGSFNNEIGLPLTALRVDAHTRFLVAEMGANHVGEIARLTSLVPPDMAVVLKVGVAHVGEFGSVERIAEAKSEMVRGLRAGGVAVLNADDAHVTAMAELADGDVLWFGMHDDGSRTGLFADEVWVDAQARATAVFHDADGGSTSVTLGVRGAHNVMNALAAASVAHAYGMPMATIAQVLHDMDRMSAHRMAVIDVPQGAGSFTVIDDSFNANPDSMRAGIEGLCAWGGENPVFRVAVLGAMLELGDDEMVLHERIGALAVERGVDAVVAVGSCDDGHVDALAEAIARGACMALDDGASVSVDLVHDIERADALVRRLSDEHPGMVALLKGSHASGLSALASRWSSAR